MFAEFGGVAGLVGDEGGFAAMRFFSLIVLAKVVFMLGKGVRALVSSFFLALFYWHSLFPLP